MGDQGKVITQILDEQATQNPDRVIFVLPNSESLEDGFRDVTVSQYAAAVNRAALFLRKSLPSDAAEQVLPYIGGADLRYMILLLAASKLGHAMFFLSPRNSPDAQRHLLRTKECHSFLVTKEVRAPVESFLTGHEQQLQLIDIPDISYFFNNFVPSAEVEENVEYEKDFERTRLQPLVYLHTSGTSTGKPKPIQVNHGYYQLDALLESLPLVDGRPVLLLQVFRENSRYMFPLPLFHVAAIYFVLVGPLLRRTTVVLPTARSSMDPVLLYKSLIASKCNVAGVAPTQLAWLNDIPEARDALRRMDAVFWGSGPTAEHVGRDVASYVRINCNGYGSTEMNLLPTVVLEDGQNDWQYQHFHPLAGIEMRSLDGTLYELVIKKQTHQNFPHVQSIFQNFPELDEYRSRDLFVRHPTKDYLWKWSSRADDLVILENGEMFNPVNMEELIVSHPLVKNCLVVGNTRPQSAALVLVAEITATTMDQLWPLIQQANKLCPNYGQVIRSLVILTTDPFATTPKGTTIRTKTEQSFADTINKAYLAVDEMSLAGVSIRDPASAESVRDFVSQVLDSSLEAEVATIDPDESLFNAGMNSLKAAEVLGLVNSQLRLSDSALRLDMTSVYGSPTINGLSRLIFNKLNPDKAASRNDDWEATLQRLLKRYSPDLSAASEITDAHSTQRQAPGAAVLTGSTGSLGAHLLHLLLNDPSVTHVYCLNRSKTTAATFSATFPQDKALVNAKATFLQTASIAAPHLGLDGTSYDELLERTKTVIHNAWPVHFHLPVESPSPAASGPNDSFEPHIQGVGSLLSFAATCRLKARMVYISSLASVAGHAAPLPESVPTDAFVAAPFGYPRSKLTSERILSDTFLRYSTKLSRPLIVRPGQIAGPTPAAVQPGATGVGSTWNAQEYIPSLLVSSAAVSALPATLGAQELTRWIPVDVCAQVTLDTIRQADSATTAASSDVGAYNVLNMASKTGKRETLWRDHLLQHARTRLAQTTNRAVDIVDAQEWLRRVEAAGVHADNPALKLLDFYASMFSSDARSGFGQDVAVDHLLEASPSFKALDPVNTAWLDTWMSGLGL